jgi:hypothetical protein
MVKSITTMVTMVITLVDHGQKQVWALATMVIIG